MRVSRRGSSLAVRLPASVVKAMELKEGDMVQIDVAGPQALAISRHPGTPELLARLRKYRGRRPDDDVFDERR